MTFSYLLSKMRNLGKRVYKMAKVYVKEIRHLKNLQLVNFQIEFSMKTGLHITYTQLHLTFIE